MDNFIIFGAKYLFIASPAITAWVFYKMSPEKRRETLILGLISLPIAFLFSLIAREVWFNPRPFVAGEFKPLIDHIADNGFPSDHTLLLASIATILSFVRQKLALTMWALTLIVGFSRVYAGVHHFVDILGSVAISLLAVALAYVIIQKLWNKNKESLTSY